MERLGRTQAAAKRKVDICGQEREETRHRTEWCAEANRYRCKRCERGSKYMKMKGKCTRQKYLSIILENGESDIWEAAICKKSGQAGWSSDLVQKMLGLCETEKMGPKLTNSCKPEQVGTKEYGKILKRIQTLEDGRVPAKEAENRKIEGQKRRISRKENKILSNEFEMGGFRAQKGLWNLARERKCCRTEEHCQRRTETLSESTRRCTKRTSRAVGRGKMWKARKKGKKTFNRETKEEVSRERERQEEKGEDGTVAVKRKCINPVSAEAFDIFSQGGSRRVVGILGVIFGMTPLVCLTVVL